MLVVDKQSLQTRLKQEATALKEKEFNLHHTNLMTVGTQAAVLAGLDITMFVEFQPPADSQWDPAFLGRFFKFFYYIMIVSAFCANIFVVAQTTTLSVLGAGLALRGPEGSMMTATDGLYEERNNVFKVFAYGLGFTLVSVVLCVTLLLHWEAAIVCICITLLTIRKVYRDFERAKSKFSFNESETVDFRDIIDGPANIRTIPNKKGKDSNSQYDVESQENQNVEHPPLSNNRNEAKQRRQQSRGRHK